MPAKGRRGGHREATWRRLSWTMCDFRAERCSALSASFRRPQQVEGRAPYTEQMSEEQQNVVPGRRGGSGDAAALYRIAYEEGKRALDDQVDELNGIRGRAVQFTAFVGSSTAFLAAVGLRTGPDRSWLFYVLAGVASALSLFAIASL